MSVTKSKLSRYCFVPGCKTGYISDRKLKKERGEIGPSLFKGLKDAIMLQQWQRAIPRADKTFGMTDVCSLHFPEEDILRFYETKLADGTINRIERGKQKLKEGSVPRIFPNLPSYLSNINKKRKLPLERTEFVDVKRRKFFPSSDPVAHSITQVESTSFNEILSKNIRPEIADNLTDVKLEITQDGTLKFENLKISLSTICTSNKQWSGTFIPGRNEVVFAEWDDSYNTIKKIIICQDMTYKVLFGKSEIILDSNKRIVSFGELENLIESINKMRVCAGIKLMSTSEWCTGIAPTKKSGQKLKLSNNCLPCKLAHRAANKNRTTKPFIVRRHEKLKGVVRCVTRKNIRLKQKNTKLRNDVEESKQKCATVTTATLEGIISGLPSTQQEAVRMCFAASKVSNSKNRRYTLAWIYECLLIRIRGRAVYEHLRSEKLLPLPCIEPLNKYISKMNGCYGFQKSTFDLLKKKSLYMKPEERRGTLLIDEMKLTETLTFDKKSLQVHGFTDLGKYTPLHQRNEKGDHALVIMFCYIVGNKKV